MQKEDARAIWNVSGIAFLIGMVPLCAALYLAVSPAKCDGKVMDEGDTCIVMGEGGGGGGLEDVEAHDRKRTRLWGGLGGVLVLGGTVGAAYGGINLLRLRR